MLVSVNDKSLYTSQVLITQLCTRASSLKVGCCAACWLLVSLCISSKISSGRQAKIH